MDVYILDFVGKNWLTLGLCLILLNGLCEIIPGEIDNKIIAIFKRMITFTRQSVPQNRKSPGMEDKGNEE